MRKALIFGPSETAVHLASALEPDGWSVEFAGLGFPSAADPDSVPRLRVRLETFAKAGGELVHPGTGEWSERPELMTLGQELGLPVLGPPARVISLFSNKLNLLTEAERLGIPHLLLSLEPFHTVREIESLITKQKLRYPLVLKAVHGVPGIPGGGYLVLQREEDLHLKLPLWLERLKRARGHAMLIAEKYLDTARLLIQPFARDSQGGIELFPMVDASLQSRYRKVVEFCPAPSIEPLAARAIQDQTKRLTDACGYIGVGTLEFLTDGERSFLVNGAARLNSTFPLWERVAGTSALEWQMATLLGPPGKMRKPRLELNPEDSSGIAFRIFAEDPVLELPQPGRVEQIILPPTTEVRSRVSPGDQVDPEGTGLLAVAYAFGDSFESVLQKGRERLDEIWIAGSVQTNERYLSEVLSHPWVAEKIFHAGFLDEEFVPTLRPPESLSSTFASVCQLASTESDRPGDRWAVGDQWAKPSAELTWLDRPVREPVGGLSGRLMEGRVLAYPLGSRPGDQDRWLVRVGAWVLTVRRVKKGAHGRSRAEVRALVGGRIHSILFQVGARVPAHEPVLILESLGEFVTQSLPKEIRVLRWLKMAGDRVEAGEPLAEFELASGS